MKALVECKFQIEIEVPDVDSTTISFSIEDNGCPGTGAVWAALSKKMEQTEESGICWACALGGSNRIISIDGKPFQETL